MDKPSINWWISFTTGTGLCHVLAFPHGTMRILSMPLPLKNQSSQPGDCAASTQRFCSSGWNNAPWLPYHIRTHGEKMKKATASDILRVLTP